MKKISVLFFFLATITAFSQQPSLPFSFTVTERTTGLPPYVSPPQMNLYNETPNFKVGWGIDYPIGNVVIDNEVWVIFNKGNQYGTHVKVARFKGADFEHTVQQDDGAIDVGPDVSTHFLGGMWYDAGTGTLYAPIHCEYKRDISPPAGWSRKKTRLATSRDKGATWRLEGDILTGCYPNDEEWLKFSGSYFEAGPADFDLYADSASGYFYIFSSNAYVPKNGKMNNFLWFNDVARSPMKDKMAPGSWRKFCNGSWNEPGLGGRASIVAMNSYGIYGRVIYSTLLKKYVRIGTCLGFADSRYTESGFKDGSIYMSTCDDLVRQVWSPKIKLFDCPANDKMGFTVTDGDARDPFTCGAALRIYNYWLYNLPSRALDVSFTSGSTPVAAFPRYGSYAYEPLPESGDTVVHRATKIVDCVHPDVRYTRGTWTDKHDPKYFHASIKQSDAPGSTVTLSFTGSAVYWRAVADTDGGRADVYIDGRREETVDCYYPQSLPFNFMFVKTGLDPKRQHTIRIVARPDKDPSSHGTVIRHMAFEYAAESYSASAGFSRIMGKNNWRYECRDSAGYHAAEFLYAEVKERDARTGKEKFSYPNCWGTARTCTIGADVLVPGTMDAVRTFRAPHAGTVRIEGSISIAKDSTRAFTCEIIRNGTITLFTRSVSLAVPAAHDITVSVKEGDALSFLVKKNTAGEGQKILWDPTVTFIDRRQGTK